MAEGGVYYFFFFQAEDGIRDHCVTGVQTCLFRSVGESVSDVIRNCFAFIISP